MLHGARNPAVRRQARPQTRTALSLLMLRSAPQACAPTLQPGGRRRRRAALVHFHAYQAPSPPPPSPCASAVFAFANISGAHFNPAVSFMLFLQGKIDGKKFFGYSVAQASGGQAFVCVCMCA